MTLIEDRLHKLENLSEALYTFEKFLRAHIAFQVVVSDIGLDANKTPKHLRHEILPEYHYFLLKEFDTARICSKMHFRYP